MSKGETKTKGVEMEGVLSSITKGKIVELLSSMSKQDPAMIKDD